MSDEKEANGIPDRSPEHAPRDAGLVIGSDARIAPNKHRKLQLTQTRRKLFGPAAKKDFLEWFAATANLGWSARQAGFNYKTVLRHRMNDPAFAEAYDRALRQGFARLQGQLLETEIDPDAEAPIGIEGDRDVPPLQKMDPDRAILLLREHGRYLAGQGAGAGQARKQGRRPRVATAEEVRAEMAKALAAFEKRCRAMGFEDPDEGTTVRRSSPGFPGEGDHA